jgi:A/G-specific adenine glycosylase
MDPQQFQTHLLKWFDQHGRKSLPWQQNKTPYRVWISEIMLQQTQVNTVIDYYTRFMQRFPDVTSLAKASQDDVLHAWAGLGYYSRARNLHRAAQIIVQQFHCELPDNLQDLQQLPGIGKSTAGAILSIAFNKPAAILDGNVKRVLTRLHGITSPINEKTIENQLWQLASHYTPVKRVADYTQAMMDLGATLCVRGVPSCSHCPFIKTCQAHEQNIAALLPRKKATRALPVRTATFLIFQKQTSILLQKRPAKGIWGGLWSLPEILHQPDKKSIQIFCKEHFGLKIITYEALKQFRHTFTHFHLDIFPIIIRPKMIRIDETRQIWYNLKQPSPIGLPKPIQTIVSML